MDKNTFSGVLVPALTPFRRNLKPNAEAFTQHCDWLLRQGADGLAVFGTTSEANSLSVDERTELLEVLVDEGIAADRLLPGTGACALPESIRLTRHATALGCGGVLMLPPFYYKGVGDEGLYSFYSQVIDEVGDVGLRIYLYHIPPMSQVAISRDLIERLIKHYPTIVVGIKDSGGDWDFTASILKNFPDLAVFPGSEIFLLDGLRHGGAGCITATGNVNPAGIRLVYEHRHDAEADRLQARISLIRRTIQSYPLIPALKSIAAGHYHSPDWLNIRPPLTGLGESQAAALGADLDAIGFSMTENRNCVLQSGR